ncbi:MAG: hypothetical protein ACRD88_00195 [Terriglobia bacterium]
MADILKTKLAGVRLYRIVPRTVYFIDNSKGFGHRNRLILGA